MKQSKSSTKIEDIKQKLQGLSSPKVILFSAACSERMIHFYNEFSEKENWGDPSEIRNSLDLVWRFLTGANIREKLESGKETVLQLTPHSDDFRSPETVIAQLAGGCIYTSIQLCLDEIAEEFKPGLIINFIFSNLQASVCYSETGAWNLGDSTEDKQFEENLLDNPSIEKEINLQKDDLDNLISQSTINLTFIEQLRNRAKENHWSAKAFLYTI